MLKKLFVILPIIIDSSRVLASKIRVDVHRQLAESGSTKVIITFKSGIRPVLALLDNVLVKQSVDVNMPRAKKLQKVVDLLTTHAMDRQKAVKDLLDQQSVILNIFGLDVPTLLHYSSFWLTNQIAFEATSLKILEKLESITNVAEIRTEQIIPMMKPVAQEAASPNSISGSWGVDRIRASSAWSKGYTGKDIVVGSIDTGVLATHEALASNFRQQFGWFDAVYGRLKPYDDLGHGTHTVGTMVGRGIGIAPDAQWIACKACTPVDCAETALLACAQFMTCPTTINGGNHSDCSKAPHIINNSWGGSLSSELLQNIVNVWIKAGIFPIFATGNFGPSCATSVAPGDFADVISVGATTINDSIGWYSGKGPASYHAEGIAKEVPIVRVKPDISAPGDNIYSAVSSSTNAYGSMTGSSMAAPHVAGVAALALSANPSLTYDQLYRLLKKSVSTTSLKTSKENCGGIPETVFPNNAYGHGLIDAVLAIENAHGKVTVASKPLAERVEKNLKLSSVDASSGTSGGVISSAKKRFTGLAFRKYSAISGYWVITTLISLVEFTLC